MWRVERSGSGRARAPPPSRSRIPDVGVRVSVILTRGNLTFGRKKIIAQRRRRRLNLLKKMIEQAQPKTIIQLPERRTPSGLMTPNAKKGLPQPHVRSDGDWSSPSFVVGYSTRLLANHTASHTSTPKAPS